jgi:NAD(P)H-hydrate epimerase
MALPGSKEGLYDAAAVREMDRVAIEELAVPGIRLMRRAADACVAALFRRWPDARQVMVYCGKGNNAGDGYIIAGKLSEQGLDVQVIMVGDADALQGDARRAYQYCLTTTAAMRPWQAGTDPGTPDVVVDALLGTGLAGNVRTPCTQVIDAINGMAAGVLAVDVPSGLCSDTGKRLGCAVNADLTVTFIGRKQGLYTLDGVDAAGEVVFDSLEVPAAVYEKVPVSVNLLDLAELHHHLAPRHRNAHKNQFGHVLVVGGNEGMGGAIAMSAEAALGCGAGLVSVATHPAHAAMLLQRRPELMVRGVTRQQDLAPMIERATVVVLGPGLGRDSWADMVHSVVLGSAVERDLPMVVDADGLNLLALGSTSAAPYDQWVLTPHPGEAAVLLTDQLAGSSVQADRFGALRQLQAAYGGAVLLKGAGTVVADDNALSLCPYGNPGMSTAGMGDVLSGVIGALLAQQMTVGVAAALGACLHARAGDMVALAQGERGMYATDLLPYLRQLVNPVARQSSARGA